MSNLFSVIKYGSTTLNSEEELFRLPDELINLYFQKVVEHFNLSHAYTDSTDRISILSYGARLYGTEMPIVFKAVLEEYDEYVRSS